MKQETNFEFFNPNPTAKKMFKSGEKKGKYPKWDKGDCTIRAFSGATGCTWIESFEMLVESARDRFDTPTSVKTCEDVLTKKFGFKKGKIETGFGKNRPTVAELAKQKKDKHCVFRVAGHMVCAFDGKYHDVWDCGDCSVYQFWEK